MRVLSHDPAEHAGAAPVLDRLSGAVSSLLAAGSLTSPDAVDDAARRLLALF